MSTWVVVAARETAVTSAAPAGLLHGIAPAAIDGFAAGALLTGLCFLLIVAPRMLRRPRPSARDAMRAGRARRAPGRPDDIMLASIGSDQASHADSGRNGRHRQPGSDADRRGDARRNAPKHAAPSADLGGKVPGATADLPLAARG
jgi:hypothetical protein